MTERRLGHLAIESCDDCHGTFLSREAVKSLYTDMGSSPAAAPAPAPSMQDEPVRYRPCPICGSLMRRSLLGAGTRVILDMCHSHGTWFDRGELLRAVTFVREGGLQAELRRERDDLGRDISRLRAEREAQAVRPGSVRLGWEYALFDLLDCLLWLWP